MAKRKVKLPTKLTGKQNVSIVCGPCRDKLARSGRPNVANVGDQPAALNMVNCALTEQTLTFEGTCGACGQQYQVTPG